MEFCNSPYPLNIMKRWVYLFLIGLLISISNGCIVKKVVRPKLTGYIYSFDSKQPLAGCKVGETYTNANGYYELAEIKTTDLTFPGMEAPPIFVHEIVSKKGYENDTIKEFNNRCGYSQVEMHWEIDTIFMKRAH